MTREEAGKLAIIAKAYADGKEIEVYKREIEKWVSIDDPSFDCHVDCYRIKPESTYHPFKDAEECFDEMKKHEPFSYITNFDVGYYSVVYISEEGISFCNGIFKNYEEALNEGYRFTDGTPFGIKEEES